VRRIRHPVATTFALLGLSFLWVPLVVVLVNSFNQDTVMSGWGGFTGSWYRQAFNDEAVRAGLRTTIVVALLSTLLSVVLAVTSMRSCTPASSCPRPCSRSRCSSSSTGSASRSG
jgi:ABC-type spermidine/putrescine transport system permease subunit II